MNVFKRLWRRIKPPDTPSPKQIPTRHVTKALAEQYRLAVQAPPTLLKDGLANATWLCMTDQGAWYAKIFAPATGTVARVQEEAALYDYLQHHGLHVPVVRPSKSGERATTLFTLNVHYALMVMRQEALKALSPATITHGELIQIAAAIGELHTVLKSYPPNPQLRASTAGRPVPDDVLTTLLASPNASLFTRAEVEHLQDLDHQMRAYLAQHPLSDALTHTVLHGDLAFDHVQLLPNQHVYFFDFADRCYGPVAHDLAVFFENFYCRTEISFRRFEQLRTWALPAYAARATLAPADYAALTPFLIRHMLSVTRYLSRLAQNRGTVVGGPAIKRRYALATYLLGDG